MYSFHAYVLWTFDKKFIFELVMRVKTQDYTVVQGLYIVFKNFQGPT